MIRILRKIPSLVGDTGLVAQGLLCLAGAVHAEETRVGSWNLKRLSHGADRDVEAMAEVAANFDLLAVQEVMNEQGV